MAAPAEAAAADGERKPTRIHITPLPDGVEEENVREVFATCGVISEVKVIEAASDGHRYCFVEFTEAPAAHAAMMMSGMQLGTGVVRISLAHAAPTADGVGIRMRAGMTSIDQANQRLYSEQLIALHQKKERAAAKERERKARAIQKQKIKEHAKRKRQLKKEGAGSDSDSFDSAMSTDERQERKRRKLRSKGSSKKRRRGGSDSDGSSLPSPPRVVFQG